MQTRPGRGGRARRRAFLRERTRPAGYVRVEPITKELPLEYAVELNRLIELAMVGSIG